MISRETFPIIARELKTACRQFMPPQPQQHLYNGLAHPADCMGMDLPACGQVHVGT